MQNALSTVSAFIDFLFAICSSPSKYQRAITHYVEETHLLAFVFDLVRARLVFTILKKIRLPSHTDWLLASVVLVHWLTMWAACL